MAELESVMATEATNAAQPDSLLSDLRRSQPRLRSQARGVQLQYRHVTDAIAALRDELTAERADHPGDGDGDAPRRRYIRQRLAWLLMALRHQRARESDLIHEAYYDAFGRHARRLLTTVIRGRQRAAPEVVWARWSRRA